MTKVSCRILTTKASKGVNGWPSFCVWVTWSKSSRRFRPRRATYLSMPPFLQSWRRALPQAARPNDPSLSSAFHCIGPQRERASISCPQLATVIHRCRSTLEVLGDLVPSLLDRLLRYARLSPAHTLEVRTRGQAGIADVVSHLHPVSCWAASRYWDQRRQ